MPTSQLPTIHSAGSELRTGRLSSLDLVEACLARIDRFDSRVRAWVSVDAEGARVQARRLDRELQAGQRRGPLHGIPVGIKDIVDEIGRAHV